MKTRIALGLVMIAVLGGLLWLDHNVGLTDPAGVSLPHDLFGMVPLGAVITILVVMAFVELARMAKQSGVPLLPVSGLLGAVSLATMPLWSSPWNPGGGLSTSRGLLPGAGLILLGIFIEQMARGRTENALRRVGCTLLAVMYLGVGMAIILTIRITGGVPMLLVFLAGVKATDIGAYFTGKAFGRHKLIPWLSPGKTWEGLLGGVLTGAGAAALTGWACGVVTLTVWQAALFGLAVALAGQLGDLCESLLKRSSNVKDSSSLLPEFGGVLDVIDSPLLAAPVAQLVLIGMGAA